MSDVTALYPAEMKNLQRQPTGMSRLWQLFGLIASWALRLSSCELHVRFFSHVSICIFTNQSRPNAALTCKHRSQGSHYYY